jgi:hypothetical protein
MSIQSEQCAVMKWNHWVNKSSQYEECVPHRCVSNRTKWKFYRELFIRPLWMCLCVDLFIRKLQALVGGIVYCKLLKLLFTLWAIFHTHELNKWPLCEIASVKSFEFRHKFPQMHILAIILMHMIIKRGRISRMT